MHSNGLDANLEGEPELESPSAELHPEESVEPLPYGRLRHVMSERLARERRAAERRLAAQRFDEDLGLEPECVAHPGCQDIEGSGDGVVDPGYECSCCDGYQVTTDGDGNPMCSEDDCAGNPCCEGGTCTDYSKQAAGMYACECKGGYKLVEEVKGKPTCERVNCGVLSELENVELNLDNFPDLHVRTWDGKDPEIDRFKGLPILQSHDTAQYTCAAGYSTDRTTHIESKTFDVACESTGIEATGICNPVQTLHIYSNAYIEKYGKAVDSMDHNPHVYEAVVLNTCKVRYSRKEIYTRVARILIAVNPFQTFHIYSNACIEKYGKAADSMDHDRTSTAWAATR